MNGPVASQLVWFSFLEGSIKKLLWRGESIPVIVLILTSTLNSFFPGPVGFLFLVLAFVVVAGNYIFFVFLAASLAIQQKWRLLGGRMTSCAVSLLLIIPSWLSGDYIHLITMYPHYRYVILQHAGAKAEPLRFPWGDSAVSVLVDCI
jgi:hypothetical protein